MISPFRRRPATGDGDQRSGSRGQVIVIFAGAMLLLVMMTAIVVDVSWYWVNSLRVQRAADAAAMAGAVLLPSDKANAYDRARHEATRNGYTGGVNGVSIFTIAKTTTPRRLDVTINATAGTFFMRILGIGEIPISRSASAEYVLPVPMGSPLNYYGVGFLRDAITKTVVTTQTTFPDRDTGLRAATVATPTSATTGWSSLDTPVNNANLIDDIEDNDSDYDFTTTNGRQQQFTTFGMTFPLTNNATVTETINAIQGIELEFEDVRLSSNCSNQNSNNNRSRIRVDLSWNNGTNFTTMIDGPQLDDNNDDFTIGDDNSLSGWGSHTWNVNDFSNPNFRVRLTGVKGQSCNSSTQVRVDRMRVIVHYEVRRVERITTTTTEMEDDIPVVSPYGEVLDNPQGFWGAMQSQGAPNIQGDAYMTKYESRQGGFPPNNVDGTDPDTDYRWPDMYSYGIEMPPNSSGGEVWIFDPGFCDASSRSGTGENWTIGGSNGNSSPQPVSAFYTLQDAGVDLYSSEDDGTKFSTSSGNTFRRLNLTDDDVIDELIDEDELDNDYDNDRSSAGDCGDQSWHYDAGDWESSSPDSPRRGWYRLGSGLTGGPNGTVYRLHTYSTDPNSLNDQNSTTALNAFAVYARANGTVKPRVYGLGAMEAYVRLPENRSSTFYLAQIDKVHAGKTMIINLWDPGDTAPLRATLEILAPNGSNYAPTRFNWRAVRGTVDGNAASCTTTGTGVFSVQTHPGGSTNGTFNGCWLTIEIAIPATYDAPHPSSDSVTPEGGWWKIRYNMGSSSSDDPFSTDLTTWQVSIRGNPVHLVLP